MLGLKVQKGPGGDEDMPQAPTDASTADSKQQQQASAAAAASSSGGGGASHQQQQEQQANGTAKVCTRSAFTDSIHATVHVNQVRNRQDSLDQHQLCCS